MDRAYRGQMPRLPKKDAKARRSTGTAELVPPGKANRFDLSHLPLEVSNLVNKVAALEKRVAELERARRSS